MASEHPWPEVKDVIPQALIYGLAKSLPLRVTELESVAHLLARNALARAKKKGR